MEIGALIFTAIKKSLCNIFLAKRIGTGRTELEVRDGCVHKGKRFERFVHPVMRMLQWPTGRNVLGSRIGE